MIAQVNVYQACFIFQAIAVGLASASRNLAGGGLCLAIVAALSAFYIPYRTSVVNADKDCRPKMELHRRKAKGIQSVLEEHSRTDSREDSASKT